MVCLFNALPYNALLQSNYIGTPYIIALQQCQHLFILLIQLNSQFSSILSLIIFFFISTNQLFFGIVCQEGLLVPQ
jgi:hypothetical protein